MKKFLYKIRTRKNELRHIKLMCKHEDQWPPAEMYLDDNPEKLRQQERISDLTYESIKVWRDKCGKKAMDEKCTECDLSFAKVKVKTPEKGRYQEKQVSYAEFSKTSRTDMHLIYEIGVLNEEDEEDEEAEEYDVVVDKSLRDDETVVTIIEVGNKETTKVVEPVKEEEEEERDELSDLLDNLDDDT